MGIDSGIYQMAGRGVKSVAEYDAEASQGRQNKLAEMMGGMKMDEYTRGVADQNALRGVYSQFGSDTAANTNALFKAGLGKEAGAYAKSAQDMAKDKAATEKDQMANTMQKLSLGSQLLGGVKDQASYDQARATAQANGLDVSRMPPAFDPAFVAQKLQEGQTVKEQLEQKWKAMEYSTPNANSVLQSQTSLSTNAATNATSRANNAATVGQAERSSLRTDARSRDANAATATKPLPATALKMQQTSLDAINIASNTQADLGAIEKQIASGKLDFGPLSNLLNRGRNAAGMSSEESRNLSTFKSSLEKMRNDSLRLNAGVQTDGDAQRAWNELFENINDKGVVIQRLAEIKKLNARAVVQHKLNVDGIRSNYGHAPMDTSGYENQGPAVGAVDTLLDKYK